MIAQHLGGYGPLGRRVRSSTETKSPLVWQHGNRAGADLPFALWNQIFRASLPEERSAVWFLFETFSRSQVCGPAAVFALASSAKCPLVFRQTVSPPVIPPQSFRSLEVGRRSAVIASAGRSAYQRTASSGSLSLASFQGALPTSRRPWNRTNSLASSLVRLGLLADSAGGASRTGPKLSSLSSLGSLSPCPKRFVTTGFRVRVAL